MNEQQDAESVTGYCPHGEPYDDNDPCPDAPPQYAERVAEGRAAFERGEVRIVPRQILVGEGIKAAEAWYRGWDAANIAAPWDLPLIDGSITERTDG